MTSTTQIRTETTVADAALRLARSYRSTLDMLLRGEISGRRDERGRWRVSVESVERAAAEVEAARHPMPTAA